MPPKTVTKLIGTLVQVVKSIAFCGARLPGSFESNRAYSDKRRDGIMCGGTRHAPRAVSIRSGWKRAACGTGASGCGSSTLLFLDSSDEEFVHSHAVHVDDLDAQFFLNEGLPGLGSVLEAIEHKTAYRPEAVLIGIVVQGEI